ncbi:MAG: two-component system, sensor histidine kinase PdtaS [Sphingomonadales bacterium]|nr:two-component system, sensor histidine kinase PdtaS [Sphingomonadales bacterium]MEA3043459.1 two-component system, sensor histidine kinase PdtaS [Sphingomonadales bacterium]
MNADKQSWIAVRWARLSTGIKMLLILSLGLLPLGIIAVLASIDNARANRAKADVEARALLMTQFQRFTLALSRNAVAIRVSRDAIIVAGDPPGLCQRTLARLDRFPNTPGRFALFGRAPPPRCLSEGFVPPPAPRPRPGETGRAIIMPGGDLLEIFLHDQAGALEGIAEYRRETLAAVLSREPTPGNFAIELVQGDRMMPLRAAAAGGALSREIVVDNPFPNNQYLMRLRTYTSPFSATELLVILTPVLMWLWASLVGWIIVQRLLLRPLERIQKLISAYRPGERGLDLPSIRSPAHEIAALGLAFDQVIQTVARHEDELEAAVVRQTRLVREVHHRVKNNLQVVASLLNLHSRGAANEEVAAAYASIQRRVDALAVVHRNHYAELEENRGVALKPLISELAANLRATAPATATGMQIRLDVAPVYANQDVAVSVTFLITEIVEFGMLCGADMVSVVVEPEGAETARLSVEVDSLAGTFDCDEALMERFDRIVTGLARQLRSTLDRDPARGRYSVRITLAGDAAA